MAGSLRAWDLLEEAQEKAIENEMDAAREGGSYHEMLSELNGRIARERALAFDPDGLRRVGRDRELRERAEALPSPLDLPGEGA